MVKQDLETLGDGKLQAITHCDPLGRVIRVGRFVGTSAPTDSQSATNRTGLTEWGYSTLSRLRWAVNPESGTVGYLYHDDGTLASRNDQRGVAAAYTYDALGRLRTQDYSDATPAVTYNYYLSSAPNVGQLQSVTSAAAPAGYAYDALGRVLSYDVDGAGG